jgi:uncharacterized membrane protein
MSERVEDYLDKLKAALRGADPATIQDALADAEDHLRTGLGQLLASEPGLGERDALHRLIRDYGAPDEIAAAYRQAESVPPPMAPPCRRDERSALARFFGVIVEPRAYASVFYLLFSFITGMCYFTVAWTGLSLSLGMIVLIIGLPVVALFLLVVQGIALVEGRIVEALLGVRMPRRPLFARKDLNLWNRFKVLFTDKLSWTAMLYMVVQMPLGVAYFSVIVTLFTLGLAWMAVPIVQYGFDLPIVTVEGYYWYAPGWLIPLVIIAGFIVILLTMHLAKAVGRVHGRYAKALLVRGQP